MSESVYKVETFAQLQNDADEIWDVGARVYTSCRPYGAFLSSNGVFHGPVERAQKAAVEHLPVLLAEVERIEGSPRDEW